MSCYRDNGEVNHLCAGRIKDKLECYKCELYEDYDVINNPHIAIRFSSSHNNEQINTEGKIVVGYQGIGKSTLARSGKGRYIDLESSIFSVRDGMRDSYVKINGWEKIYCKIAEHLAEQGYTVFVSSHAEVRKILKESKCKVVAVVPHPDLDKFWIEKLKKRYFDTELEKDRRAWLNAKDRYRENIMEIMNDFYNEGDTAQRVFVIDNMNYRLEDYV